MKLLLVIFLYAYDYILFTHSNLPRPEYAPYSCIRNVLIGYLHETLDSSALALQYYSKGGCLVEQRRLMYCLVQQFLVHIDKLKLLVVSEPSSPHLGHSTNHSSHHNSGMLNSMSALSTILATYTNQSNSATPPVVRFLEHCKTISPLIGMHAYRLVLELLYTDLVHQLEAFFDKDQVRLFVGSVFCSCVRFSFFSCGGVCFHHFHLPAIRFSKMFHATRVPFSILFLL